MLRDKISVGSKIFDVVNYTLLGLLALVMVIPFVHVVGSSFATSAEIAETSFLLFPTEFSLNAYKYIFSTDTILRALLISVTVTVGGTLWSMFLSTLTAYGLSRKDLVGRRFFNFLIVFTILFNGGMIPTFLVVEQTGLLNSLWALIIPVSINAFNMIILRSFFMNLPAGLEESAKIDGASDFGILFRIVIPCSLPAIATISLFYAVTYWNTYMHAILYISDSAKWPVQVLLRQIVVLASGINYDGATYTDVPPPEVTVKMATIVVATVPVLLVYPFLQKYFAKGALLGSVKG
ncbi:MULTISPECIES: carbohydrate ABC transporter permease [Oceanobacillus]|uniref:carbohydrate ABC transporter permease n=1 Tax=Oceanobacillus TaxID=182709 RepID=UPI000475EBAB|nr:MULTISPECIES: carbohydrate ABC transporter permease [Oceanobacillus]MBT2598156.1 carbohydrate ABC transporter permease [Oceanobacillus sp. ISL-74]MBT2651075.1 carbohydrate ABC transporter permease [Oceanobacillus sp. ISL-73]MCT1575739.1 carbohydrate ABC transporter permease [Oceanobacillus kimchii]MCT2135376.1 carbohydrate ABC transporter permease [Oceanobacillus kimchii]OEH55483.1 ABC transporter permease [Oceanobacillus sp. E9]